jgi:hypothetical protein
MGVDHFIYGWFLFAVLLAVVFPIGLRFADAPAGNGELTAIRRAPGAWSVHLGHLPVAAACAAALLLTGPAMLWLRENGGVQLAPAGELALPVNVGQARLEMVTPEAGWLAPLPGWAGRHGAYRDGAGRFEIDIFRRVAGTRGPELAGLRERLKADAVTLVSDGPLAIAGQGSPAVTVREMRVKSAGGERLAAYWFEVGGAITANPVTAKIMEVRRQLTGKPANPVLVAVSIATTGLDRPENYLRQLASHLVGMTGPCKGRRQGDGRACADVDGSGGTVTGDRG